MSAQPKSYFNLNPSEKAIIDTIIDFYNNLHENYTLIWGGSSTLSKQKKQYSDIDFWVLTDNPEKLKSISYKYFSKIEALNFIYPGGYLPWIGNYLTLYFFENCTLSVDIGFCDKNNTKDLNFGPSPVIVNGMHKDIDHISYKNYSTDLEERLIGILNNVLKIRKCLNQDFIWNSIEYLNRIRREYMALIANYPSINTIYYIRPERKIENYITSSQKQKLSKTCPSYSHASVVNCLSIIINLINIKINAVAYKWSLIDELNNQLNLLREKYYEK